VPGPKRAALDFFTKTLEKIDRISGAPLFGDIKAIRIRVGLLVKFKKPKIDIKRMVLDFPKGSAGNTRPSRPGIGLRSSAWVCG
jgi:hypothetical protein